MADSETLALILDVLRTNQLHESRCAYLVQLRRKQASYQDYWEPEEPCDCWLADPANDEKPPAQPGG